MCAAARRPKSALRISTFKGLQLEQSPAFVASFVRYRAMIAAQGVLATLAAHRASRGGIGHVSREVDLKGRVAVVTGGGQGIGFACAQALGEAGATVVVAEMMPERVESATAALKRLGLSAVGMTLDVTKSAQVDEVAARVERELGPAHVLVNNAGVAKSDVRAEDTSDEHWRFHMDVNVDGLFWCCRAFGRQMLVAGRGSIVNIGSMSGFIVNKPQPQAFYNASKAAVHHLTKSLACEWAPARRPRQRRGADLHRDAADQVRHRGKSGHVPDLARDDADGPRRPARGDRLDRAVPGRRRLQPAHRQHRAGRWRLYLLVNTMKLEGKVAIVTGGARGIGAAICRRYADEGARVVVADLLYGRGRALWRPRSAVVPWACGSM